MARWFVGAGLALAVLLVVLVGMVFAVSESRINRTYALEPAALIIAPDASMVARGMAIATYRGCRDCHGDNLAGRLVADAMPVMRLASPNITPGGVTRNYTDVDWARTIRHGVRPDGTPVRFMPSFEYTALSHADMAALLAYVKSVPAVAEAAVPFAVGPLGRVLHLAGELPLLPVELIDHNAEPAEPTPGPTADYGSYLATACIGCHGPGLSGGPIPGVPPDWPPSANLTRHVTGLADWRFEDFRTALREGKRPDGSAIRGEYMPWRLIAQSSDDDIRALWEFIGTMPPRTAGLR
jgi:mono/diheme cytochrome c family protein